MTRIPLLAATASVVLACAPALAQETFDLRALTSQDPKVGEPVHVLHRTQQDLDMSMRQGGRVVRQDRRTTGHEATYLEEVLETDADHDPLRVARTYERFVDLATGQDAPASGVRVLFTRTGSTWAFAHDGGPAIPPELATQLADELEDKNAREEKDLGGLEEAFLPERPVAIGATWSIDAVAAGRALGMAEDAVVTEESACTGELQRGEDRAGEPWLRLVLSLRVAVRALDGRPLPRPAALELTFTGDLPARVGCADYELTGAGGMQLNVTPPNAPRGTNAEVRTRVETTERRTQVEVR